MKEIPMQPTRIPASFVIVVALACICTDAAWSDDRTPVGHWKLAGDTKDSSGHGVTF